MLFQITHTHAPETCPAVHAEHSATLRRCYEALRVSGEVKVVGAFASPLDHVFHFTVEAAELASVVRAMAPLNAIGTAKTEPVMRLEDLISLVAQEGATEQA
jgi:hypothetical protein